MRRFPWIESLLVMALGLALIVQPRTRQLSDSSEQVVLSTTIPQRADEFDQILHGAVKGERVDYDLIRRRYWAPLNAYLDSLADANLDGLPKNDLLAYYINLYNATMIRAVLDRWHNGFTPSEDDFAVFKSPLVRLPGGKTVSLYYLENDIIRPTFKDPRVHAALNCAARSCAPLLNRAYRGEDLDQTLDANMKRFILDPARNKIDDEKKELELSRIFDWYAGDFGGKDKIAAYAGKYAGKDLQGYHVNFMPYDWTLNATP